MNKKGTKQRPTLFRKELYDAVLAARSDGNSYGRIIKNIEERFHVRLSKSHVYTWVRGIHEPLGSVRIPDLAPRPELAYVIGVIRGDGTISENRNHAYKIRLQANDKEFVTEFARCLSVVLNRSKPPVKWIQRRNIWQAEASSLLLRNFLRQSLDILCESTAHCDRCKGSFLRGFYDSEGSIRGRRLTATNGNLETLTLACSLLGSLGIQTTGPHLSSKSGGLVIIRGKPYRKNLNMYYLYIRVASLMKFQEKVGFSIIRKATALGKALAHSGR